MKTLVERLLADMDDAFRGEDVPSRWHVSVMTSVEGLSAAQAAWTPAPRRNSIWKIVQHLSLWKEDVARRIAGQPRRTEGWGKEHDWKEIPAATDQAWQASLRRLRDVHASVSAELARRSDEDLHAPPRGDEAPLYTAIRGVIAHDSYHCGQICYIRALQGVPARTW
jgi:uncharacterized damage-inducible protein DinB